MGVGMEYVLVAPFGFALIVATLLFAHSRQLGRAAVRSGAHLRRAAVRSGAHLRRAKPSSH
jgi:hypothetical protein